jgi:predicted kinase
MAKIVPSKPILVLLYGYPGAGKTYFARQFCEQVQAAHVQGERIRSELFEKPHYDKEENSVVTQLMDYMTHEFLSAGLSAVYDANAMRLKQRHELREMARKGKAQTVLIWFQIDTESAFERNVKRDKRRVDDKYAAKHDRTTFDSIISGMQNPGKAENYVVISGKHVFSTQCGAVIKRLNELGLVTYSDAAAKLVKPGMVNLIPSKNPIAGRVDMSRRNIIIR